MKKWMKNRNQLLPTPKMKIEHVQFAESTRTDRCGDQLNAITFVVWAVGKLGLIDILNAHFADIE